MRKLMVLALALAAAGAAGAATQSVVLSVPGMNCPTCPITVKHALTQVAGVQSVQVSLARRQARVAFDAAKTNPAALARATTEAGYPAHVLGRSK